MTFGAIIIIIGVVIVYVAINRPLSQSTPQTPTQPGPPLVGPDPGTTPIPTNYLQGTTSA